MTKKKPYLPNNWQQYKDAPDELFLQHTFDEFMDWKVAGWALPSSVACILRVTDINTKKVKEYTYQRRSSAEAKVKKLLDTAGHEGKEFTICDSDNIHFLTPKD